MSAKRKSTLSQRIQDGHEIEEGLLDIPHPIILRYRTPTELKKEFEEKWGRKLKGVILPVVAPDGLLFPVEDSGQLPSRYEKNADKFKGWKQSVKDFSDLGLDIYLLLDPTMPFVGTDALHVVDITGDGSAQVCFGNVRARELAAAILLTAVDEALDVIDYKKSKLAGVVIDAINLFPMGSGNRGRLELTCFCESCLAHFHKSDKKFLDKFRDFPNPWNLALKDSGSGISFASNIPPETNAAQVVGLARQKAFDEIFGAEKDNEPRMREYADELLKYIEIRHKQVVLGLKDIFDQVLDFQGAQAPPEPIKKIVIMEGVHYDWTSGLQLGRLDAAKTQKGNFCPVDEVWFNPTSSEMKTNHLEFRSYMWKRSRYFVDAFFSTVANASDPIKRASTGIGRLSDSEVRELLRDRLATVIATEEPGKASLASLPDLKITDDRGNELPGNKGQRLGFIGVALTEEIGGELIKTISIPPGKPNESKGGEASMADMLRVIMEMKERTDG
jgi:hypothetical protein